jgi:CRISPR-associated endonuclease Csn1
LNDTRYASRLAAQYLGLLYGGVVDGERKRRVFTCAGELTAILRREWGLNRILGGGSEIKSRDDHRHHAVDAVTVAMCSEQQVQELSRLAGLAGSEGKRLFGRMAQEPWTGFKDAVAEKINSTVVSPRPQYKLQGQLHDETFYSAPRRGPDGKTYIHKRVAVEDADPAQIVDARVRAAVEAKLAAGATKKTLAGDPPVLVTKSGKEVPIRRVRIRVAREAALARLGEGPRARHVLADALHHTEIVRNEEGKKVRFDHYPVTTLEAMRRKRAGEPIVRREFGERCALICTLRPGDVIEAAKTPDGPRELWRVRTVKSSGQMEVHRLSDARTKQEIQKSGGMWGPTVNSLFSKGARKVRITHLGEVIPAHD